jgi:hypothetical protein
MKRIKHSPRSWERERFGTIDQERLKRIIELHPDAPVEMLASAALEQPTPYLSSYRVAS